MQIKGNRGVLIDQWLGEARHQTRNRRSEDRLEDLDGVTNTPLRIMHHIHQLAILLVSCHQLNHQTTLKSGSILEIAKNPSFWRAMVGGLDLPGSWSPTSILSITKTIRNTFNVQVIVLIGVMLTLSKKAGLWSERGL